jgi:hypothetical protein
MNGGKRQGIAPFVWLNTAFATRTAHPAAEPARANMALISQRMRTSIEAGGRSAKLRPCSIFRIFETAAFAVRGD